MTVTEHIGWLKIYIADMKVDNWADMRLRCERQLNELTAALSGQAVVPPPSQVELRKLVDVVWNEATESTAVPSTTWADRLIAKVFPASPAGAE